jgi:hypothetical protein
MIKRTADLALVTHNVVLQLRHVLFGRRLFGERPGQRKLGLEHRIEIIDESVERRGHLPFDRMLHPALDVGDGAPGVALIPASVQRLGDDPELDNQVPRQVFGFDLPRFSFHSRITA